MNIYHKISHVTISEKTKENLTRKSEFVDEVQLLADGTPCFSWLDLSLTELCNRACIFCPRVDPDVYPNQNLNFSVELAGKLGNELRAISYKGGVVFSGYGEPLLHPRLSEIVQAFGGLRTEIVTNGDRLTVEKIRGLFECGLTFMCVSMYDGPHQEDAFKKMFAEAGVGEHAFILRDRWHNEADQFGLKLTNRAGVLRYGPAESFADRPCHYPAYSMAIDWNGDVLLCVQDWQKKVKFGNVAVNDLAEVWKSIRLDQVRRRLIDGKRTSAPCKGCNADGTLHGFNHVNEWGRLGGR